MSDERTITVAEVSDGPGGSGEPGSDVSLPVIELLTGRGFVTGKSGAGKSIVEGTPVYTETGRKPIEAVSEGERVLSLDRHTYEQEFREVQATIRHESEALLRITLEDGTEIVGTEDHSFLTADDLEIVPVRGEDVSEGTWMPLPRTLPEPETVSEIDLGEYLPDANNVVVDGDVIRSGPRTEPRTLALDFETGKVVGLYLAEGSLDGHKTIQISNVDDDVQAFLGSQGFNVYDRSCNKGFRPLANFLESEFGTGSDGKRVPDWVYNSPRAFRTGLLSGYIDGDGTVSESTVAVMSAAPELIDGVAEICRQLGISTTIRDKFTMYEGDRRRYQRLRVDAFSLDRLRELVDLTIESKRRQLERACEALDSGEQHNQKDMIPNFGPILNLAAREQGWTERESERRVAGASVHHLTRKQKAGRDTYNRFVSELGIEGRAKQFGESDIQWKRVVDVEPIDEQRTVYDLDVAGNDNFVANGVFVHNSNSASVIAENLLDSGFGLLIVDIDGEYYGLKEEYEILHVGADEECDIQVTTEHAEKIAGLALEENVPIILDISSFLDDDEAEQLLTEVSKHLFAKAKKLKQPFLLLVEEVHEWIPENGSVSEAGKMLIKIGKRGRKHGLGVVGISQRPADVKKDYITQCDWLVWHRLTWNNDTKVVRRVLDGEYADAVEDLGDGEAFLMTDWSESIRRVQFHRKQTFDAGATPGLDDFERPELKSVSDDLVSELQEISEEERQREDTIAELREELDKKNSRIAELERELQDARDLSRMADQFVDAMLDQVEGASPGRTETERMRARRQRREEQDTTDEQTGPEQDDGEATSEQAEGGERTGDTADARDNGEIEEKTPSMDEVADAAEAFAAAMDDGSGDASDGESTDEEALEFEPFEAPADLEESADALDFSDADMPAFGFETGSHGSEGSDDEAIAEAVGAVDGTDESSVDRPMPAAVSSLRTEIRNLDEKARRMLAYYDEQGPATPLDAHFVAGGTGDRTDAYAHNRRLRTAGLIEHVGRGNYDVCLRKRLDETTNGRLAENELDAFRDELAIAFGRTESDRD
ncbi:HerA helicase [Halapricum desulfuricans]|uniref:HerA helicase n=1 Tax=Halapricum desulfuricans TaxID=2841257 RepID=A0A897NFN0_9EURY|nr:HerA helicase [Halapricum desulfuricans]